MFLDRVNKNKTDLVTIKQYNLQNEMELLSLKANPTKILKNLFNNVFKNYLNRTKKWF